MRYIVLPALLSLAACAAPRAVDAPPASPPQPISTPKKAEAPPPADEAPIAIRGERGDLAVFTIDEKPAKLSDFGAEVTVIAVWGTNCVPCVKELPMVEATWQSYRGDARVAFIALALDDFRDAARRGAVREMAVRLGLTMPVVFDKDIGVYRRINGEDGPSGKKHEGIRVPQLAIIDRRFRVRRQIGFDAKQSKEDFVRAQRALIDAALRGELPPEIDTPTSPAVVRPSGDVALLK